MTLLGLGLDILLITMLGVMIFFVMRLHNRLEIVRSGKQDLETLLQNLVVTTGAAERSLNDIRDTAGELAMTLQKQIAGAANAREELEFLLSSADKVAETLVSQVGAAREASRQPADVPASPLRDRMRTAPMAAPVAPAAPTLNVPAASAGTPKPAAATAASAATSRDAAENDLLRAIEKLR